MSRDFVTTHIHRRVTMAADGTRRERVFVRCPTDGDWEPLEGCRRCGACAHLSTPERKEDWLLVCESETPKRRRKAPKESPPVSEAMEHAVLCVARDLPVAKLARAMIDDRHDVAIVVDQDDRPIGVVSPGDLKGAATAGDAMTPFATTLLEGAPVARALDLAVEGLHEIPILSAGRVMGLASPRSLLAWLLRPR